jgi:putative ABC transport system permease protein
MSFLQQILRSLLLQWGFSASVIAIVALGVGANAAVFAVVYSVLLQELPFSASNDIMVLKEAGKSFDTGLVSPTAYLEWRDRNPPFSEMTAFMWWEGRGEDRALTVSITPNYFDVMRVKPLIGRTFTEEENREGFGSAMILSYEIWQRRFGGDPGIVGKRAKEGNWSPLVVGIMPPAHINLNIGWGHIWRPIRLRQQYNRSEITSARYLRVIGRLRPGITGAGALAAMNAIQNGLQNERPEIFAGYEVRVSTLREAFAGESRPALLILLGTTSCLLLLASAPLANMLVARSAANEKEMAVRLALGATRSHLAARLLAGNLVLAAAGSSPGDVNAYAYQSLRNPRAGEEGDRNVFRLPHYTTMDMGLEKSFRMPFPEQHSLQFRWEVFNVTNSQPFGRLDGNDTVNQDPNLSIPAAQRGQFTRPTTPAGETRPGRIMQFALRYSF